MAEVVVQQSSRDKSHEDVRTRAAAVGDLLALAREQFQTVSNAETQLREDMTDDMRFVASDQWDPTALAEREQDERPAMTINRLSQFIRQVVNQVRVAHQGIEVVPVSQGARQETAEIFQGIIRHIEEESDAQRAYVTGAEAQARMGRGYWRIVSEFEPEGGFAQNLFIRRVRNPFLVFMDPTIQEVDGSDARYCFVVQDLAKDVYIERFGAASLSGLNEFFTSNTRYAQDWMPIGRVRIAEWWRIESVWDEELLVRWPDGTGMQVHQSVYTTWPSDAKQQVEIIKRRPLERRTVKCAVINAVDILEGNEDKTDGIEWPGSRIPIFPVLGEEIDLNGRVDYRGMVRDAKDAQTMYNVESTAFVEMLMLSPKAPYIGYAGQFENHEAKWGLANKRNFPYLEINPKSLDGNLLPLPQRTQFDPGIGAIGQAIAQQEQNLQATMGLYNPSLGVGQSGHQSGRAIDSLQRQGEIANSNFQDNLMSTIRATGRHLVEIIPRFYDVPRVLRIVGDDGKSQNVMVHSGGANAPEGDAESNGVDGIYDLSVGKYDVVVTVGPSQATKRQEALAGLSTIIQANPAAFQLLGDLVVENMDWPGAKEAAARLKQTLPPGMQDESGQDEIPPAVAAKMSQMGQQAQQIQAQLQAVTAELAKAKQIIDQKQIEMQIAQGDWASRERVANIDLEKAKVTAGIRAHVDMSKAQMAAQAAGAEGAAARMHDRALSAQEHDQQVRHTTLQAQTDLIHQAHAAQSDLAQQEPTTPPAPTQKPRLSVGLALKGEDLSDPAVRQILTEEGLPVAPSPGPPVAP